jgi:hypothetical protein
MSAVNWYAFAGMVATALFVIIFIVVAERQRRSGK